MVAGGEDAGRPHALLVGRGRPGEVDRLSGPAVEGDLGRAQRGPGRGHPGQVGTREVNGHGRVGACPVVAAEGGGRGVERVPRALIDEVVVGLFVPDEAGGRDQVSHHVKSVDADGGVVRGGVLRAGPFHSQSVRAFVEAVRAPHRLPVDWCSGCRGPRCPSRHRPG